MPKLPPIAVHVGDSEEPARFHASWWRGPEATFIPAKENLRESDAIEKYILAGWLPDRPFIDRDTPITVFGSCFAKHVSRHLNERGYRILGADLKLDAHIIRYGEGFVNTFVILQQLEWALEGKSIPDDLWVDADDNFVEAGQAARDDTLDLIRQTEVFIITLGLTEIWYNKITGEPLWRAVSADRYDPAMHGFRVSTFQENYDNLRRIHDLIRSARPNATLVFTLSPVPLMATFRPISCITASSVSKATLRAALDQMIRDCDGDDRLLYFPSYEIVKDFFVDPYRDDNRHPKQEVIDTIMETFERHYCVQ